MIKDGELILNFLTNRMTEYGERLKEIEYSPRLGSYAVIIKDNRIGVIKSSVFDKYFLVGGAIETGETEAEALRREAIEEIGFEIEVGEKLESAVEYFYAEIDECYFAKQCNFYLASVLNRVKKNSETELIWIDKDALDEMYHRSHQWIVRKELNLRQSGRR